MARRKSDKFLTAIPEKYEPNFHERIDKRTSVGRVIVERMAALHSDLGGLGCLSHAKQSLVKRAVWLESIVEAYEQSIATRQTIDLGAYTQAINALIGLYRQLGIERRQKPARGLGDIIDGNAA